MFEDRIDEIQEVCRRFGVKRLDLFGSALKDDYAPGQSDIDLLVEFESMEPYARVEAYFALRDELERSLGSAIDLVVSGAVKNAVIAKDIDRTKRLLYAA
jgi:predicted nucleotidyltransferase